MTTILREVVGRGCRTIRVALRAHTPVHDLGFVDLEAVCLAGCQAGPHVQGAVDVFNPTAHPTRDVVVVVARASLETGWVSVKFDPSHQAVIGTGTQNVIDGLNRNAAQMPTDALKYLIGGCVRVAIEPIQDSASRGGGPQPDVSQLMRSSGLVDAPGIQKGCLLF